MLPGFNLRDGMSIFDWAPFGKKLLDGDRQKKIILDPGIYLDLFIVREPADWGVIFAIRTGPDTFSKWLVTQRKWGGALPSDSRVAGGRVLRNDIPVRMPEEADLFAFCGLPYIEPCERTVELGKKLIAKGPNAQVCPVCHGTATGPRLAGTGGCNTCNGNGVV
jgi:hypothetical protein